MAVSRVKVYVFERLQLLMSVRSFLASQAKDVTHITRGPSASALTSDIVRVAPLILHAWLGTRSMSWPCCI